MFPTLVLMPFHSDIKLNPNILFFNFIFKHSDINPNQTSVLWYYTLYLYMGGTLFQSLILSRFNFFFFVGLNPRPWGWHLSRGLPRVYNMSCENGHVLNDFQNKILKLSRQAQSIWGAKAIQPVSRCHFCICFFLYYALSRCSFRLQLSGLIERK